MMILLHCEIHPGVGSVDPDRLRTWRVQVPQGVVVLERLHHGPGARVQQAGVHQIQRRDRGIGAQQRCDGLSTLGAQGVALQPQPLDLVRVRVRQGLADRRYAVPIELVAGDVPDPDVAVARADEPGDPLSPGRTHDVVPEQEPIDVDVVGQGRQQRPDPRGPDHLLTQIQSPVGHHRAPGEGPGHQGLLLSAEEAQQGIELVEGARDHRDRPGAAEILGWAADHRERPPGLGQQLLQHLAPGQPLGDRLVAHALAPARIVEVPDRGGRLEEGEQEAPSVDHALDRRSPHT